MKKRIISIMIMLVLLINLIPVSFVHAADEKVTVTVTADKTTAERSNEITYTITCEATEQLSSIYLELDIPEGLTYVANSGALDENLETAIGDVSEASYTEATKIITIAHELPFTLNGAVTIATFKCTVDDSAKGDYTVGLKEAEFTDANIDIMPEAEYKIVTATTNVVVPVTEISLNKTETTIDAGETETLVATIAPSDATNTKVNWESSDSTIATVSETGVVTGVVKGTATITATTEDGNYSATCSITVLCAHENTTTHPAVPSTCMVQGNNEYVTCDDCDEIISGSDEKLPLGDHTYGTLIQKVDPIHTSTKLEDGTEAHYKCSVCQKLFDEDKNEVVEEDLVIKAPSHTYGDWEVDTTNHWKECGCGNIVNQGVHTGGEATCTDKANCEVCGIEYGELDEDNHVDTKIINAEEAKCEEEGYTGDVYCNDCQKTVETGTKVDPVGHTGGEATCTDKAICEECQEEYGELDEDNHVDTELKNAKEAKCEEEGYTGDLYCNDCKETVETGTKVEPKGHTGGEATCTDKAICEECQEEYGELDEDNHANTEIKDAVEATTEKEGYTGDVYCKDCETLVEKGKVIPMKEVETEPEEEKNPTKPQTDDNSNMMLWVSLLVISGICFVIISKCKTKRTVSKH